MLTRRARALSIAQATQLINRRNALVIDVRSADEYQCGHLPRARRIGLDELQAGLRASPKIKIIPSCWSARLACAHGALRRLLNRWVIPKYLDCKAAWQPGRQRDCH